MTIRIATVGVLAMALFASSAPVSAQTATTGDWRTVAPDNLLVIDTAKGRILVEFEPRMAPVSVERVRTLANQGFYDGLTFHRVLPGFMAQTGDPLGTGAGGSDLPDIAPEFEFRRGRDLDFVSVMSAPTGQMGLVGSMPIVTQPDAQMMVTADFKAGAQGLFCPGVAGMARSQDVDSANSQFFLMTGRNDTLNGLYTPFGRVVSGLEVVRSLKAGVEGTNGRVQDPDVMDRVRTAAAMPEGDRPVVRVRVATTAAFAPAVERLRAERGAEFTVCDVQPAAEVVGG